MNRSILHIILFTFIGIVLITNPISGSTCSANDSKTNPHQQAFKSISEANYLNVYIDDSDFDYKINDSNALYEERLFHYPQFFTVISSIFHSDVYIRAPGLSEPNLKI